MRSVRTPVAALAAFLSLSFAPTPAAAVPLTGDQTTVLVTSIDTLVGAGLSVSGLGTAIVGNDNVGRVEAVFPITGGDVTGIVGNILHDGSGLQLSNVVATVDLENFDINTMVGQLFGDVTVDGGFVANLPLFDVGVCLDLVGTAGECIDGDGSILLNGFKLTLTPDAGGALANVLGIPNLSGAQIGVARVDVRVPEPASLALLGSALAAFSMGHWRRRRL